LVEESNDVLGGHHGQVDKHAGYFGCVGWVLADLLGHWEQDLTKDTPLLLDFHLLELVELRLQLQDLLLDGHISVHGLLRSTSLHLWGELLALGRHWHTFLWEVTLGTHVWFSAKLLILLESWVHLLLVWLILVVVSVVVVVILAVTVLVSSASSTRPVLVESSSLEVSSTAHSHHHHLLHLLHHLRVHHGLHHLHELHHHVVVHDVHLRHVSILTSHSEHVTHLFLLNLLLQHLMILLSDFFWLSLLDISWLFWVGGQGLDSWVGAAFVDGFLAIFFGGEVDHSELFLF